MRKKKCCQNCRSYQQRTKFCRRFPPIPVTITIKVDESDNTEISKPIDAERSIVVSKWPVPSYPDSDYCDEYVEVK